MDVNLYVLEALSRDRLAELRAGAAAHGLARAAVPLRRRLRRGVGRTLIRLGTWALGSGHGSLARHTS
jgi:hypothetical protein